MKYQTVNVEIDVKGLKCPLPILRAKKALGTMESGEVLRVIATDPASVKDFAAFCKQSGNSLISSVVEGNEYTFVMAKR